MARSSTSGGSAAKEVGKEALAYCTSCKMDLNHVIVALQGDRLARVQCKTCKKEHAYKAPKGATEPTTPKAKKGKKADAEPSSTPVELEWQKLMETHKAAQTKPYSAKTPFLLGDKLNHPVFGDGIVMKLIHPNKLEIIFRTDLKVLIHGGHPAIG